MNEIVLNRENENLAAIIAAVTGRSVEEVVESLLRSFLKNKTVN